jgi:hypothetical protein
MDKPIIIFGSSRSHGNTFTAVNQVINAIGESPLIDLANNELFRLLFSLYG